MAQRTDVARGPATGPSVPGWRDGRANGGHSRQSGGPAVAPDAPVVRRPDLFGNGNRPISPADLVALQRTVGNRATSALLRRYRSTTAATTMIQRQPTVPQLREFSLRYNAVLNELRRGARITKYHKQLAELLIVAEKYTLKTALPSMFQQLSALAELAGQKSPDLDRLVAILSAFEPGARTGSAAFGAFAGAVFTPEIKGGDERQGSGGGHGGGEFVGEAMQKRANAEGKDSGIDVEARINLVIAEIAAAYRAHRARFDPHRASPFDRTLLVFVGPEWFFRRPDRPYTRDELKAVIRAMVAISALFPEMLIVPGTVISADKSMFSGWKNVTNTAIVVWNGNLLKTIDKASDCGDTCGLVAGGRFLGGQESPIFGLGDLTFALDICVDFTARRAQQAVEKEKAEADLHILTSAGQGPDPRNTATRHGGFILHADSTGGMFPADLRHLSKTSEGRRGESIKGTVLEQDTGHNEKAGLIPLLTYYDPRAFARHGHGEGHGPDPRLSSPAPSVTIIDARSGEELERRPLASVHAGTGKKDKDEEKEKETEH